MLATKFLDDQWCTNRYWGTIGGVSAAEMNGLELELLYVLRFSLHISEQDFALYNTEVERRQHLVVRSPTVIVRDITRGESPTARFKRELEEDSDSPERKATQGSSFSARTTPSTSTATSPVNAKRVAGSRAFRYQKDEASPVCD